MTFDQKVRWNLYQPRFIRWLKCLYFHHCLWAEFQQTCSPRRAIHSSLKWVTPFLADYATPWHLLAPRLFLLLKDIDSIPEFRGCVPWVVLLPRTWLGRLYCLRRRRVLCCCSWQRWLTVTTCIWCYARKWIPFKMKWNRISKNVFYVYKVPISSIVICSHWNEKHSYLVAS